MGKAIEREASKEVSLNAPEEPKEQTTREHLLSDSLFLAKNKAASDDKAVPESKSASESKPISENKSVFEKKSVAENKAASENGTKNRVIDIKDADKTFGWWQKKQYSDIGVLKIHLMPDKVALDLKAPAEKYNTLQLDRKVSFDFETKKDGWTISNVQGLKLKEQPITKVESNASKILFHTGNKTTDYGGAVNNYFKALFDPLMRKDLRN